jgi:catechol 2,3-dioxygenase-like lactoylglutathione lyase family enzyme
MKQFNLSPLHQVEYAVADLAESQEFFQQVFGESEVEQTFSQVLTNPALAISHAGFGEVVQQFCQPLMEGLPHYDALQANGSCVHNLCYLVDSIDNIVANCRDVELETLIEFPMDDNWRKLIPEDNLQGNHQSYIINTRAVLGFQLELAETPWIREPQPPLMLPAHGPQWPGLGVASGNILRGINVVVEDLEQTLAALQAVFAGNTTVIMPPHITSDGSLKTMVVELGLIRMVYLQPLQEGSELAVFLQQRGPAVHSLVAEVRDLVRVETGLGVYDIESSPPEAALLVAIEQEQLGERRALQVHSLAQVGVEFTLLEVVD